MSTRNGVVIRDARDSDREAIGRLTLAAYEQYAAVLPAPLWERYRGQLLSTLDTGGPVQRIVAERDGPLVGSVMLFPPAATTYTTATVVLESPEVRLLAVAPDARGEGIGRALMDECARRAREAGARYLGLHTTDMMRAAMRLYERLGYRRAPEVDFTPAPGFVVKGYRLDLGRA